MFSTCTPHHILTSKQKKEQFKSSAPLAQKFHDIKTAPTQKRQERNTSALKTWLGQKGHTEGWTQHMLRKLVTVATLGSSVLYLTLVSLAHGLPDVRCDPHDLVRSDSGETALWNALCTFICS